MLELIVCMKQVPMVSELPWDSKTGTLRRELAEGMMDPASKRALEAALQIKEIHGATVTTITMGPPMAAEILHEAQAMGADQGILLTDRRMAGADTFLTSFILSSVIQKKFNRVDLVLCGARTSDSETAQVGPQLAQDLGLPSVSFVRQIQMRGDRVRVWRQVDDFAEILEMDLPGLITVDLDGFSPRHVPLEGIQAAFEKPRMIFLNAEDIGLDPGLNAIKDSPTRIIEVYSPTSQKENIVMKGAVKTMIEQLFDTHGKTISGAMGKDLKTHDHGGE